MATTILALSAVAGPASARYIAAGAVTTNSCASPKCKREAQGAAAQLRKLYTLHCGKSAPVLDSPLGSLAMVANDQLDLFGNSADSSQLCATGNSI
jgi:hypothetical protein